MLFPVLVNVIQFNVPQLLLRVKVIRAPSLTVQSGQAAYECGPPCQTRSIACYHVYLSISEDVLISVPVPGNTDSAAPHSGSIRLP